MLAFVEEKPDGWSGEPFGSKPLLAHCLLCSLWGAMAGQSSPAAAQTKPISDQEANAIAVDAYLYFYPLVIMDLTRRQMTNLPAGKDWALVRQTHSIT